MNILTEMSTGDRIVKIAAERFFSSGFSKVTMDELAYELGMSKKTLYKFYPNKIALLHAAVETTLDSLKNGFEEILADCNLEFTAKLQTVLTFMGMQVSKFLQKSFLRDLQRTAPEVWERIEFFRKEMIHTRFARLIDEGMRSGAFRNDVSQDLVVLVYFSAIQRIINPETLAQLPFTSHDAFQAIFTLLLEGLLTDESRDKLRSE